jgi:hypothetical protein
VALVEVIAEQFFYSLLGTIVPKHNHSNRQKNTEKIFSGIVISYREVNNHYLRSTKYVHRRNHKNTQSHISKADEWRTSATGNNKQNARTGKLGTYTSQYGAMAV